MRAVTSANDPNSDMGRSKYISSTGLRAYAWSSLVVMDLFEEEIAWCKERRATAIGDLREFCTGRVNFAIRSISLQYWKPELVEI